jgi:DNA-directed RNA polymerase subunit RPC12/RpoP
MTDDKIIQAHKHSSKHRREIEASGICGCFHCGETFAPSAIRDWTDRRQTARCPHCGIDSVIGDASGYPVTDEKFLKGMRDYWF